MKTLEKFSRCSLAVLLAAFVCLCPPNLTAMAEEIPNAATPQASVPGEQPEDEAITADAPVAEAAVEDATDGAAAADEVQADEAVPASDEATDAASADQNGETDSVEAVDADNAQADAADATSFDVASASELAAAFNKAQTGSESSYTINITADFTLDGQGASNAYMASTGKTVTLLGNGHTLTYAAGAAANVALGSNGGTLNLGSLSGDSLTITAAGANEGAALIQVTGGTVNMYNGVTLTGTTGSTYGGAVYVKGGTFNMNGGSITDCSAVEGGGAYVAQGTMTMGGNAVISNCSTTPMGNANASGGGVLLDKGGVMTMGASSAITGCSASAKFGGGVDIERGATLTMADNATISGNTATRGGGVLNQGTFTGGEVYNNTASDSGDDVYNRGTFTPQAIADANLTLATDGQAIDGWYYDGYHKAAGATETTRWSAGDGQDAATAYAVQFDATGKTSEMAALKAAHAATPVTEDPATDPDDSNTNTADENTNTGDENTNTGDETTEIPSSFDVASDEEYMEAMDLINTGDGGEYTINVVGDFDLDGHTRKQHHLMPMSGQTIDLIGNGHTIGYVTDTESQLALGSAGGVLNLGKPDGSDSLTITLHATDTDDPLLIAFNGGTINMYDGVTLSDNANRTGLGGGAVDVQNGTFNMYGGLITNCTGTTVTYGGAVCLQGGTFNMTGGTIDGCHAESGQGRPGLGGAVAVGMTGAADTFNMSGDAVIKNCKAENGGGVYIYAGSMTMSGNALIENCEAETINGGGNGGGVYVNENGTLTMSDNATITGNSAVYGGGIISWGTVTATAVHNNTATTAGDDIYNDGTITVASAKEKGWILNSTGKTIDGWYYDGHRETGDTDENGNAVVDRTRWTLADAADNSGAASPDAPGTIDDKPIAFNSGVNAPEAASMMMLAEDDATDDAAAATPGKYVMEFTNTDAPTTETMALKAAHDTADTPDPKPTPDDPEPTPEPVDHDINVYWETDDGTVLFEEDNIEPSEVPPADEYTDLSGHDNPTKAEDADYTYEFSGWSKSTDDAGDVIYTAQFQAIPKDHNGDDPDEPDTPDDPSNTNTPDDPTPDDPAANTNTDTNTGTTTGTSTYNTVSGNRLVQTGDANTPLAAALIAGMALSVAGIVYSRRKMAEGE